MPGMAYQECVIPDSNCPIARIWELQGTEQAGQRIVPDGHAEIIVHLADPFQEFRNGTWKTQQPTLMCGQITRPMLVRPRGETHTVGFRLRSWATGPLGRDVAAAFTDESVDKVACAEQLRELANKFLRRSGNLSRVVDPVRSCIGTHSKVDNRLKNAVALAHLSRGQCTVDRMAEVASVSARQLDRLMLRHVGVTPKLFLRLRRFQNVMAQAQSTYRSWADLAAACGYCDQSHLLRDFGQFVGKNPGQACGPDSDLAHYFLDQPEAGVA